MKRILFLLVAVAGLMALSLTAQAVDLDQGVCETNLGGTWDAGTSTCTAGFVFITDDPLVVPAGVTLDVDFVDALDVTVENYGTIDVELDWHNHGLLDNFGSFTADTMIHDTVVNHCGSTYTVDFDISASTTFLDCSLITGLTADPTSGTAPLTVDWTVTVENDGDETLDPVSVELSTDGGATAFATLTGPPDSGDDGDGLLEVGETWQWLVQTTESADVTVTATAAGTAPSSLVVTFPDDAEARSSAAVTVAAPPTTSSTSTTSSTTTTSPPPETTTTLGGATTSTGQSDVGAATLPLTGDAEGWDLGTLAVSLMALGALTVLLFTRQPEQE